MLSCLPITETTDVLVDNKLSRILTDINYIWLSLEAIVSDKFC